MLVRKEHYDYMKQEIQKVYHESIETINSNIQNDKRIKNPAIYKAFTLSYYAGISNYICQNIYDYANDKHLETALLKIVKEIEG